MAKSPSAPRQVGRYRIYGPIASGGMATVHFGALVGEGGFSRTVAIKRLRADRKSAALVAGLLDEARLVSRIQHPNVVPTLDVVTTDDGEVLVILEYVAGESLSRLLRRLDELEEGIPLRYITTTMAGVLHGLHAAHDAKSVRGKPLGIVHRDVSPQNILVGVDGLARVLDFGIAKAAERLSRSVAGQVKGKLGYIAPEQLKNKVDRRTDIYSAAVVLWEMLTRRRLFWGKNNFEVLDKVMDMEVRPPSDLADGIPAKLDALVLRNLSRAPNDRQDTARQFALSLEDIAVATASQVGGWVQHVAGEALSRRSEIVAELERDASGHSDVTLLREAGGAPTEREGSSDEHGTRSTLERERGPETDVVTTSAGLGAAPVVDGDTVDTLVHARSTPISAPSDVADERSEAEGTKRLVLSPREGSATVAEPPRRERRGVWAAAMVLAALLGALGVILLRRGGEPTTDRGGDPGLGPLQTASASASRSESASGSASASAAASAPASGSASATVSAPALPMGSGWRSPGVAQPAPRASVAATAVPAAKPCDPPFTVDERGIRRLKPECM